MLYSVTAKPTDTQEKVGGFGRYEKIETARTEHLRGAESGLGPLENLLLLSALGLGCLQLEACHS